MKSRKRPSPEPCHAGTLIIDAQNLELEEMYLFVVYKPLSLWFSIKAHRTYQDMIVLPFLVTNV